MEAIGSTIGACPGRGGGGGGIGGANILEM